MEFDPQLYFLKKKYENISKIESLQDILCFFQTKYNHDDKDKNDLYSDTISDIFLSYFIRFIPFETWKNFIHQEIYINSSQINNFITQNAFFPIRNIILDESLSHFQQERKIKHLIHEYDSFPDVYNSSLIQKLLQLSLDDWKHILSFFPSYNKRTSASFENLVHLYDKKYPVQMIDTKNFLSKYKFFSFLTLYDSINNININKNTITTFFNEKSHFENDVFWLNNEYSYNLTYTLNNKTFPYTENEYNIHKNCLDIDKSSYVFKIPFAIFSDVEKEFIFEHFISILPLTFQNNLRHILKISHLPDGSFGNVLDSFHNIVARIHPSFFGKLHNTYILNIENNIFIPRYLPSLSHKNAFPELDLFSSYNKVIFEKEWSNSSILFKQEFIDSFTHKTHFKTRKQINNEHINIDHIDFLTKNKSKISENNVLKKEIQKQKELSNIKQTMDSLFFKKV